MSVSTENNVDLFLRVYLFKKEKSQLE